MIKKIMILIILFYPIQIYGIRVNLTDDEIQEAITLGEKHKDNVWSVINKTYRFGTHRDLLKRYGTVREKCTVWTKRAELILTSADELKKYKKISSSMIEEILNSKKLAIYIFTDGFNVTFADSYHVVLIQQKDGKENIVQPEIINIPKLPDVSSSKMSDTIFTSSVKAYFSYDKIDLLAKTTVVLVKSDQKDSKFQIDFSKLDERKGKVIDEDGKVRIDPFLNSEIITSLNSGSQVSIVDENENWYSIRLKENKFGWIQKESVNLIK